MRTRLALVCLTALTLPLAACGSTDDGQENPGATDAASSEAAAPSQSGSSGSAAPAAQCPPADGAAERTTQFSGPPPMCIDANASYAATVTTDAGEFTVALDAKQAPKTVNNFVFLARNKFYDGVVFHRVLQGFMAQGGDPEGTGQGGPGYEFEDELPQQGQYEIGSVAMANAGPNTNGSQFFIITGDQGTQLPPQYSLFGKVTKGMDVVKKIEADGSAGDPEPPATTHKIESVKITES